MITLGNVCFMMALYHWSWNSASSASFKFYIPFFPAKRWQIRNQNADSRDRRIDKERQANWLFNVWVENSQSCCQLVGIVWLVISFWTWFWNSTELELRDFQRQAKWLKKSLIVPSSNIWVENIQNYRYKINFDWLLNKLLDLLYLWLVSISVERC